MVLVSRQAIASAGVLVPSAPRLLVACGGRSPAAASKCLEATGLLVLAGTVDIPKEIKGGPRSIPKLEVLGARNAAMDGNHAVIVFASTDSDAGSAIFIYPGITRPPSFPTGADFVAYEDRKFFVVWDATPTDSQTRLIEGCLK